MDDISPGDASVMASGAVYAEALVLLGLLTANGTVNAEPLLIAPAAGMGGGAILATFTEADPGRVLALTATALAFALTYLFTSGPGASTSPRRAARAVDRLLPTAVVMPTGAGGRE